MMKILVTGGTGFIGSALATQLITDGHEVIITGSKTEQTVDNALYLDNSFLGLDFSVLNDIDVVFHEAANNDTLDLNVSQIYRANISGPMSLFKHLYQKGCRKFIYASSTAVYGNEMPPYCENKTKLRPLNPYGESKKIFDLWAKQFSETTDAICIGLRYCNVYGPGESHKGKRKSMIGQLIDQMAAGQAPKLFKYGEQQRDWIYIDDVVKANLLALEYDKSDIFNCGFGKAVSFLEIHDIINQKMKSGIEPHWIDNPNPDLYQIFTECNMAKAAKELKFTPEFDVNAGIQKYLLLMNATEQLTNTSVSG